MKYQMARKQKMSQETQTNFSIDKSRGIKKSHRNVIQICDDYSEDENQSLDNRDPPIIHFSPLNNTPEIIIDDQPLQTQTSKKNESYFRKTSPNQTIISKSQIKNSQKQNQKPIPISKKLKNSASHIPHQILRKKAKLKLIQQGFKEPFKDSGQPQQISLLNLSDSSSDSDISSQSISRHSLLQRHQPQKIKPKFISGFRILDSLDHWSWKAQRIERIQRGMNEKIYLLSVTRDMKSCWKFVVLGSQKTHYHVQLTRNLPRSEQNLQTHMSTCSCIDFSRHLLPCKHIYFVFTQVAKADFLLNPISQGAQIKDKDFSQLDRLLMEKLGARILKQQRPHQQKAMEPKSRNQQQKKHQQKFLMNQNQTQQCPMCFQGMETKQKLEICPICRKSIHAECLKKWKQYRESCPLCRGVFNKPQLLHQPAALHYLSSIEIYHNEPIILEN